MSGSSKAGDETKAIETFDQLWTHVENDLGVAVPAYIKNILKLSGFDNRLTIRSISEKDIDHLEIFARSDFYREKGYYHKSSDYYGIYEYSDKKNFKIPLGHRRLLLCVVDHLKQAHHNSVKTE